MKNSILKSVGCALTLACVIAMHPDAMANPSLHRDFTVDHVNYEILDATLHTVATCSGSEPVGNVVIPSTVTNPADGVAYTVVEVGYNCFANASSLVSVTVPSTVTKIENFAFAASPVKTVVLPQSVATIGNNAFANCTQLTSVNLPEGLAEMEWNIFSGCTQLPSIVIPESVTTIGMSALRDCTSLTSVTLPSTLEALPDRMFSGCRNLPVINLPQTLKSIGQYAFYQCSALTAITLPSSLETVGDAAFNSSAVASVNVADLSRFLSIDFFNSQANPLYVCGGHLKVNGEDVTTLTIPASLESLGDYCLAGGIAGQTSLTIPGTIKTVGRGAFSGWTTLTSVTLEEGVETLGAVSFSCCNGLTSIAFPSSMRRVMHQSFEYCNRLARVDSPSWEDWLSIEFGSAGQSMGVNDQKSSNPLSVAHKLYIGGQEVTAYQFPSTVTTILPYAFAGGINGITTLEIPSHVTTIGEGAFLGCQALTSLSLPASLTQIGDNSFSSCKGLTEITIPGVPVLGQYAFSNNSALTTVVMQEGVETIGVSTFYNCSSLANIEFPSSLRAISSLAFGYCSSIRDLVLPEGLLSIGSAAFYSTSWSNRMKNITLPSTLVCIDENAFYGQEEIRQIDSYINDPLAITDIGINDPSTGYGYDSTLWSEVWNYATLRIPTGTRNLYLQVYPFTNFTTIQATLEPVTGIDAPKVAEETIEMNGGVLTFGGMIEIYDASGMRVAIGHDTVSLRELPKGIYFVLGTTADGAMRSRKVIF